jgi:hypothetical protein
MHWANAEFQDNKGLKQEGVPVKKPEPLPLFYIFPLRSPHKVRMAYRTGNDDFSLSFGYTQFVPAFWAAEISVDIMIACFHGCIVLLRAETGMDIAHPVPKRIPPAEEPGVFFPALFLIPGHHPENTESQCSNGKQE